MILKRNLKKILFSILGITFLFFAILVYHIASKKPIDNATVQVSRIDFDKPFDSLGAIAIEKQIRSIPGVKMDVVISKNILVYFHEKKIANSKQIFNQLMAKGDYKAQRFLIPDSIAAKSVCPVMDENSYKYKFSAFIQRIF